MSKAKVEIEDSSFLINQTALPIQGSDGWDDRNTDNPTADSRAAADVQQETKPRLSPSEKLS